MKRTVMAVAVLAATACAGSEPSGTPTPQGSVERGSPVGASTEWLAVFLVAQDPRDLDDETEELMGAAPEAMIVSPVGCHDGLADELDADAGAYVIGVVARSKEELDRAVEDARRSTPFADEPLFRGELTVLCGVS